MVHIQLEVGFGGLGERLKAGKPLLEREAAAWRRRWCPEHEV